VYANTSSDLNTNPRNIGITTATSPRMSVMSTDMEEMLRGLEQIGRPSRRSVLMRLERDYENNTIDDDDVISMLSKSTKSFSDH
jgi:ribose 1,5-bisphosphokinase PhnN